nr:catenin delta 2 [Hymenolepis microstoma]
MPLRAQSEEFLDTYYVDDLKKSATVDNVQSEFISLNGRQYLRKYQNLRIPNLVGNLNCFGSSLRVYQSNTDLSTSTDIPCLVNRLQSTNPTVQATAAACIQHVIFKNEDAKNEAWQSGALSGLIKLLISDDPSVVANSTAALRNLTSGSNVQLCVEFEQCNGLNALTWLVDQCDKVAFKYEQNINDEKAKIFSERIQKILDNASAIFCNISALEEMRNNVMAETVVPVLASTVLIPIAEESFQNFHNYTGDNLPPYTSMLYRNCTAVIRNMSCGKDAAIRSQVRRCRGLLESLLRVLRVASTSGFADIKAVENCICAIRNLAYALRENSVSTNNGSKPLASRLIDRAFGSLSRNKPIEEGDQRDTPELGPTSAESVLWHPDAVATFLLVLSRTSNPVCLEAAAGVIQNLTASKKWPPAAVVRTEVRLQQGLPTLVNLLHSSDSPVAITAAMALQNITLERESLIELGRHSLSTLVTCLSTESDLIRSRSLSSLTSFATSTTIFQIPTNVNLQMLMPVLCLCSRIVLCQNNFASRFVELGGVQRLNSLVQFLNSEKGSIQWDTRKMCIQATIQLLKALWKIKILHSFYSECGLSEEDFLYKKANIIQKKSKTRPQSRNRRVPLTRAQQYALTEDRSRGKCRQARSYRPNYEQREVVPRAPSAASSAYQLSLFSNSTRGQSVGALRRDFDQPINYRVAYPQTTFTRKSRRVPLTKTHEGNISDEQQDFGSVNSLDGLRSRQVSQKSNKSQGQNKWREVSENVLELAIDSSTSKNSRNPTFGVGSLDTLKETPPNLPPRSQSSSRTLSHL